MDAQIDATCTKSGWSKRVYCSTCNVVFKERKRIPAKGHLVVTDAAVEATCTKEGLTDYVYCPECETVLVEQKVIPMTPHAWNQGVVEKEATETEEGIICYTCTPCGTTKKESIPVKESSGIIGDANGDGKVDLADAQLTLKVALKILDAFPEKQ